MSNALRTDRLLLLLAVYTWMVYNTLPGHHVFTVPSFKALFILALQIGFKSVSNQFQFRAAT